MDTFNMARYLELVIDRLIMDLLIFSPLTWALIAVFCVFLLVMVNYMLLLHLVPLCVFMFALLLL